MFTLAMSGMLIIEVSVEIKITGGICPATLVVAVNEVTGSVRQRGETGGTFIYTVAVASKLKGEQVKGVQFITTVNAPPVDIT